MLCRNPRANALRAMKAGRPKAQRCESCMRRKKRCHHAPEDAAEEIQEHSSRLGRVSREPSRFHTDVTYSTAVRDQRASRAVVIHQPYRTPYGIVTSNFRAGCRGTRRPGPRSDGRAQSRPQVAVYNARLPLKTYRLRKKRVRRRFSVLL